MSVIVKGMEMPTSCASCRMAVCFADTGKAKCYATLSYIDPERGKRSYDCPLRPLPEKHGRLIDADILENGLRYMAKYQHGERQQGILGCCETIRLASAIIPAEEEPTIVEAEGDN